MTTNYPGDIATFNGQFHSELNNMQADHNIKKLLFRRQFILGPSFVDAFPWWKRINIANNLCLTAHPDLNTYQCVRDNKSITLLGYILDPNDPDATDKNIVDLLTEQFLKPGDIQSFIEQTYNYGGRWVLIVDDGNEVYLFNDALGFRQIFYTTKKYCEDTWCASQPGALAEAINLQYDDNDLKKFFDCYEKDDGQYWWPNDRTAFKEVKHLLANHYLNLASGKNIRYWPNQNITELSLDEGIKRGAKLLKGLVKSAANRYELAFTITAGRDTRLLLAASREIRHKIFFFTMMYWRMTKGSADVVIPSRLLKKLGLQHHVIKCPPQMENKFKYIYEQKCANSP